MWFKLLSSFFATWAFVRATTPPFRPGPGDSVRRDHSAAINFLATSLPRYSTVLIWCIEACQLVATLWQSEHELPFCSGVALGHWSLLEQIGICLMISGSLLRLWCYHCLGRFFTFQLTIRQDHELIMTGPYSLLRHPSYTGALLMVLGWSVHTFSSNSLASCIFPSLVRNRFALVAVAVVTVSGIVNRIATEEKMLKVEFGDRWTAYTEKTWRLLPFIW